MSKGGAGKVYFVLYLAVVLELLIIIVERDEAEEHLHQKQKAAEAIVRSILSQLQSGAGTEGINTRPQDEITLADAGILQQIKDDLKVSIKSDRTYNIEVGVSDISADVNLKEGESLAEYKDRMTKLISLANVSELKYEIYYADLQGGPSSPDSYNAPDFPSDDSLDVLIKKDSANPNVPNGWKKLGEERLLMNEKELVDKYFEKEEVKSSINTVPNIFMHPNYITAIGANLSKFKPPEAEKMFYYSPEKTEASADVKSGKKGINKRTFVVNFRPESQGWYKLRFSSKTNKILGVKLQNAGESKEIPDEAKVNIGTVAIKIGDLKKVEKSLMNELAAYIGDANWEELKTPEDIEKFKAIIKKGKEDLKADLEDRNKIAANIDLYNYIAMLITPGEYANFKQNQGAIEFNVRVVKPEAPKKGIPVIIAEDEFFRFDGVEPAFNLSISPYQKGKNQFIGDIYEDAEKKIKIGKLEFKPLKSIEPTEGGSQELIAIAKLDNELKINDGTYKVLYAVITHDVNNSGKKAINDKIKLVIFPSNDISIRESNIDLCNDSRKYLNEFDFKFNVSSGGKIKGNQFKYIFTSNDRQSPLVREGLDTKSNSTNADQIVLTEKTEKASLALYWMDPITQKDVLLFKNDTLKPSWLPIKINKDKIKLTSNIEKKDIECSISNMSISDKNFTAALNDIHTVKVKISSDKGSVDISSKTLKVLKGNKLEDLNFVISANLSKKQVKEGDNFNVKLQFTIISKTPGGLEFTSTIPITLNGSF